MAKTGHGASIIFDDVTAFVPDYRSIEGWGMSRPVLDTSHLATPKTRTNMGGDLYEMQGFSCDILYDPGDAKNNYNDILFNGTAAREAGLIEIVRADGAKESFQGYVTEFSRQALGTDVLEAATVTIQPAGEVTTTAGA